MTLRTTHESNRISACGYQRQRRMSPSGLIAHLPSLDERKPPAAAIRQIQHCTLPATAQSCGAARRFADRTLTEWGFPQLADELFLVISELVTNAVRHGAGLCDDPAAGGEPLNDEGDHPIQVTLLRDDRHLVCAVIDPSDMPPVVAEVEHSREGGRGLRLVEAFSQLWGWAPIRSGGKMVWAAFAVPDRLGRRIR